MTPPADDAAAAADAPAPLRSVHTSNLPQIFAEAGLSVLVTTYQAGKLVILRNNQGVLNTHFRNFMKPMGLAVSGGKLAIGCNVDIWEFHNVPAVCPRLDAHEENKDTGFQHDACFLPRRSHTTGDVQIHEMAWVNDELWFVNTSFSCLATRSDTNSFEPRWRPKFVTEFVPGDYCHLNGLAMRDGRVRYVTALGETNSLGGWRENKRNGGLLIDVDSNEIIARGLSMPHSPRWYRNKLWLLGIGRRQHRHGRSEDGPLRSHRPVARLYAGHLVLRSAGLCRFVASSRVGRLQWHSAWSSGSKNAPAACGSSTSRRDKPIGFCRFEDAVQEIFAVEVLVGSRFPDLINHDAELIGRSYVLGDEALAQVPEDLRSETRI